MPRIFKNLFEGDRYFKEGAISEALQTYFQAETEALQHQQNREQVTLKIKNILYSIEGQLSHSFIPFNDQGQPLYPSRLRWFFSRGTASFLVLGWPLQCQFIQSRGRAPQRVQSDSQGKGLCSVTYIDPYKDKAVLRISPLWHEWGASTGSVARLFWEAEYFKQMKLALLIDGAAPSLGEKNKFDSLRWLFCLFNKLIFL